MLTCDGVVGPSSVPSSLTHGHGRSHTRAWMVSHTGMDGLTHGHGRSQTRAWTVSHTGVDDVAAREQIEHCLGDNDK